MRPAEVLAQGEAGVLQDGQRVHVGAQTQALVAVAALELCHQAVPPRPRVTS